MITVNGEEWATSASPIRIGNSLIEKIYVGENLIYPDEFVPYGEKKYSFYWLLEPTVCYASNRNIGTADERGVIMYPGGSDPQVYRAAIHFTPGSFTVAMSGEGVHGMTVNGYIALEGKTKEVLYNYVWPDDVSPYVDSMGNPVYWLSANEAIYGPDNRTLLSSYATSFCGPDDTLVRICATVEELRRYMTGEID